MAVGSSGETSDWFTPRRFALILGALLFATFPGVVLGTNSFFYRDYGFLGYPFVFFARDCLWNGELPLWNPYVNCGAPFLAQWNTLALYPGSPIYLLLPLPWGLGVFCLAHWMLGGLGMRALAERWTGDRFAAAVAGVAFVFGGTSLTSHIYPNYLVTFGWMPWVVLLVESACREGGRSLAPAALAGAMQMMSGAPELILMTWALALALLAVSGFGFRVSGSEVEVQGSKFKVQSWLLPFGRFSLVVALVAALSAVVLLPFFDLLSQSQRAKDFGGGELGAGFWSLPAWGWANFIVPLFHCFKTPQGIYVQAGQSFLPSYYAGLGVLTLAVLAVWRVRERRVWVLAAATLLAALLAMGTNSFLYPMVAKLVPVEFMRFPVKFILLVAFTLPLLAAFAVFELQGSKFKVQSSWLVVGATVLCFAVVRGWAGLSAMPTDDLAATTASAATRMLLAALVTGAVVLLARPHRAQMRLVLQVGAIALIWLDLITHSPRQNPVISSDAFAQGLAQAYHKLDPAPRVGEGRVMLSPQAEMAMHTRMLPDFKDDFLGQRVALWGNLNILDHLPKVNGATTLISRESAEVNRLLYGSTNSFPALMDFLAVTHATAPGELMKFAPRTARRSWVSIGQRPVFADAAESLRVIGTPQFKPSEEVLLPAEARGVVTAGASAKAVVSKSQFWPCRVVVAVESPEPSMLVIAQSWYPGWTATVDGKPARVWRANHALQAVEIPAGATLVMLKYREPRLAAGAVVSLLACGACGALWRRARPSADASTPPPGGRT
jgi:hypothetical protein